MNRLELITEVARVTRTPKTTTNRVLDGLVAVIQQHVAQGDTVKIAGFGSFSRVPVAARAGRNPKTGASLKIAAGQKPKFVAGQAFRQIVSKGEKGPL